MDEIEKNWLASSSSMEEKTVIYTGGPTASISVSGGKGTGGSTKFSLYWDQLLYGEPPVTNFKDIRFPEPILRKLTATGILPLTPIQLHALRAVLSGKDLFGISLAGCGKNLVYVLPLIMVALQQHGCGFGLVLCPSADTAKKTYYQVLEPFLVALQEYGGDRYPELKSTVYVDESDEHMVEDLMNMHIIFTTPRKLNFMVANNKVKLQKCRYLTLDEADITDVVHLFEAVPKPQTLLFYPTITGKEWNLARSILRDYATVFAKGMLTNLRVSQRIEYVNQNEKLPYILDCIHETGRYPVLVLCENRIDVESVCQYLVSRNIRAVALHSGMDQEESAISISAFKSKEKDVLVATDAASRGLYYADTQHVINYDMPTEINNYIRRVALARSDRSRVATTFINNKAATNALLELKNLLTQTKQTIPLILADLPTRTTNAQMTT